MGRRARDIKITPSYCVFSHQNSCLIKYRTVFYLFNRIDTTFKHVPRIGQDDIYICLNLRIINLFKSSLKIFVLYSSAWCISVT